MDVMIEIITNFENSDRGILCTSRVINEGVSIPIFDSVCFLDARFSTVDVVHCIGRSLRLYKGKNCAYILVPTFIKNFSDDFDKSVYTNIIGILRALKNIDTRVVEQFTNRHINKLSNNSLFLVEGINLTDETIKNDIESWFKNIEIRLWDHIDPFESMYVRVNEWINENDRMPTLTSKNATEHKFGGWRCTQRYLKLKDN